jgi:glycerophosphoryl diester phosphodiesterase
MVPLIIAHRGDSAQFPENTLKAFAGALEVGADLVETDVHLSRDGHVIVMHDARVDRTTSGTGPLSEMTLAEIRALSAGYPERFGDRYSGERVPTLAEALALMRGRARLMIEIKSEAVVPGNGEDGIEARTIAEVRKAGMVSEVALISFDRRALVRCRDQAPEITRGHLFQSDRELPPSEIVAGAREVGTELVMPEKRMLNDAIHSAARDAGLKLATWIVDDPVELRSLARFEPYGVATNRPGILLDAIWESD